VITVGAWHVGEVFLSMLYFVLFFVWLWLAISVFLDIFRSHDLSGMAKALWVAFIIILPYIGVFVYLIARGGTMHERTVKAVQQSQDDFRQYVASVAGGGKSVAAELEHLARLRDQGVITEDEFATLKAKAMAGAG
jgi:ABC-type multidrug transport system fused ATPase/permease subunit